MPPNPRPWPAALHPFLFAAVPVVRLLAANPDPAYVGISVGWVLASWAVVALALLVLSPRLGLRRAALVVTVGLAACIVRFPGAWEAPFLLFLAVVGAVIVRARAELEVVATFANLMATILLAGSVAGSVGWTEPRAAVREGYLEALDAQVPRERPEPPDVWWILLDGHGRRDVLSEKYGVDDGFDDWLRSRGFYVATDARANYLQTAFSLASTLNLEPVEALITGADPASTQRQAIGRVARVNRVTRLFRERGYRVVAWPSEYRLTRPEGTDEVRGPVGVLHEFELALLQTTLLPALTSAVSGEPAWVQHRLRRRDLRWTLDDLARGDRDPGPTLVLVHLLAPHPPFVFRRDGSPRPSRAEGALSDGSHWDEVHAGLGDDYVEGYAEQVEWLHGQLRTAIDGILAHSERPPVILLQGDHGPGTDLDWNSLENTDLRERAAILSAYRLPMGSDELYPSITPVNSFRVVLNALFGAELPLLPDRTVFHGYDHPYDTTDVTDRLGPILRE